MLQNVQIYYQIHSFLQHSLQYLRLVPHLFLLLWKNTLFLTLYHHRSTHRSKPINEPPCKNQKNSDFIAEPSNTQFKKTGFEPKIGVEDQNEDNPTNTKSAEESGRGTAKRAWSSGNAVSNCNSQSHTQSLCAKYHLSP